jgi:hypothetical protein
MYLMLIVKDVNYLATHQKKLATHKCVATPWLRTTGIDNESYFSTLATENKFLATPDPKYDAKLLSIKASITSSMER